MKEISLYLDELLAQRRVIHQTFYSYQQNLDENNRSLMACLRLLKKVKNNGAEDNAQLVLFQAENAAELVEAIRENTRFEADDLLLLLQLMLSRQQALTAEVISALVQCKEHILQLMASQLHLALGVTNEQEPLLPFVLAKCNVEAYHICLLAGYYHNTLMKTLSLAVDKRENEAFGDDNELENYIKKQAPLRRLYLRVLLTVATPEIEMPKITNQTESEPLVLLKDFVEHEYLNTHLFEIFIVSLDEASLTRVINQLTSWQDNVSAPDCIQAEHSQQSLEESLIFAMALSGYSKFIPFLARYLQKPGYTQQAYTGLRLMLGDKLDQFIPLAIQFASDEAQRLTDLSYYGAKILGCWQQLLTVNQAPEKLQGGSEVGPEQATEQMPVKKEVPARLFNGLPITLDNIKTTFVQGSLLHRRYASLHQKILSPQQRVSHYLSVAG
ncbi:hypothetical protein [Thalassomonas actiniarum]|uniref:Uncharacterized protein n=1 Tax=Thalassomonas actiniarum TaxID=485447 RepID=A0AAE9YU14_9GAMM|nr:hypothetical protein [Thalassomonas actiniarum]WDE01196.1 hypothetical protein SG35_011460 [Thalassomonas actiniarum]